MDRPTKNSQLMVFAIKAEAAAAQRERRHPSTKNVIAMFREQQMYPRLTEKQVVELFDVVFACVLDVTGARGTRHQDLSRRASIDQGERGGRGCSAD